MADAQFADGLRGRRGRASYLHRGRPFETAVEAGIPVVMLGSHAPEPGVDAVGPDDVGGGRRAVQYLLERDRRRIGFLTPEARRRKTRRREAALQATLTHSHVRGRS